MCAFMAWWKIKNLPGEPILFRFMEATRPMNESIKRPENPILWFDLVRWLDLPKKRPMTMVIKKCPESKASSSKKVSYGKKEAKQLPVLPPFLCGVEEGSGSPWVVGEISCIFLPEVKFLPSVTDHKDAGSSCSIVGKVISWSNALPSWEFSIKT